MENHSETYQNQTLASVGQGFSQRDDEISNEIERVDPRSLWRNMPFVAGRHRHEKRISGHPIPIRLTTLDARGDRSDRTWLALINDVDDYRDSIQR